MCAEVGGRPAERRAEVGAADIADEQRVSRQYRIRFRRVLLQIEDENRDGFNGVAGRLQHFEPQTRKLERVSVLHGDERVFRLGARAEMNGRATTVAEFQMPRHEVGVEMREEYVANPQAKRLGVR